MPIYDFSSRQQEEFIEEPVSAVKVESQPQKKGQFFSQIASRLFFVLLLIADLIWLGYALLSFLVCILLRCATGGKVSWMQGWQSRKWVSLRRSVVCAMALVIAIFSPSFGMMVACTYFLMYDKKGIDEVFPSALQSQFKDLIPKESTE